MQVVTHLGRWGRFVAVAALVAAALVSLPGGAGAASPGQSVADHWTTARMEAAIPRDLVVDERGQGHLRRPDGTLEPYGGSGTTPAARPTNPGGGNGGGGGGNSDTTGPAVTIVDPSPADEVTATPHTFAATVTDPGGVKTVTFHVTSPGGSTSSHVASLASGDTWTASIALSNGVWSWTVEARDGAKRGGNTTLTDAVAFSVALPADDPGDPAPDEGTVTNAEWTAGGTVQTAAGRIYFEMPSNGPRWGGYVCSGTVATDTVSARSIIITAAHCVYDEVNDVFARNVLFIPNQDETSGSGTDTTCTNDPLGCWAPTHGVVHQDWVTGRWPDIIPHDYGYYVVPTTGAHEGTAADPALEVAAGSLAVQFTSATQGAFTHALGYSYSEDPNFMYCAEDLGIDASYNSLWLSQCGLSGGASGGPWMQPVNGGNGPIIGVNSYGYSNQPGMGAAHLTGTAACLLGVAENGSTPPSTVRGIVSGCR